MIVIGIILTLIGLGMAVCLLSDNEYMFSLVGVGIFILGVGAIIYDVYSPVEVILKEEYISNKLNNITFSEPVKIKQYKHQPERFLAIFNEETTYKIEVIADEVSN